MKVKLSNRILWWVFGILSIGVGLYPLLYFIIDRKFGLLGTKSEILLSDLIWNVGFYTHIILGGLALGIGWMQFSNRLRTKRLQLHRTIGKIYVIAVLLSGITGLYIGYHATGGWIPALGFMSLAVVWLYTTTGAFIAIKKGQVDKHQKLMIYSYACCFGAVTLRIWLPLLIVLYEGAFIPAYRIVAWLAWVPNILVAYFIIRRLHPKRA